MGLWEDVVKLRKQAEKLAFHFNVSLTALNLTEAIQQHSGEHPFVFSMASVKRRMFNHPLLEQLICNLDLEPSQIKSHPNYANLCNYGMITL